MNNPRTRLDDEALKDAADKLQRIQLACLQTTRGISMSEACKIQGLDYLAVRRLLLTKVFGQCDLLNELKSLEDSVVLYLNGYEMLYSAVFELGNDLSQINLPVDYKDTVENVLKTLSDRESRILKMHCGIDPVIPMSYTDIAKEFNLSIDRIIQIEHKALRLLRYPSRSDELLKGSMRFNAEKDLEEAKIAEHQKKLEEWKFQQLENMKHGDIEHDEDVTYDMSLISLDDMKLSVRTYNCLKRAGKNTLLDIVEMSDNDLMKVRNLGRHCMKEILEKRDLYVAQIMSHQKED